MSSNTRKPLVGGNWKCNGTQESIKKLIDSFNNAKVETQKVDVVVAPTFIHLPSVKATLRSDFHVAAQNCYTTTGAFTGEVSADLLKDFGVEWVVLGHSERRQVFGETDALIGAKTAKALGLGLAVIACLGETLEQREQGKTLEVITSQLASFAKNVSNWTDKFVIAYEPVWAIGTGKVATAAQAQEAHAALRAWIKDNVNAQVAENVRIIYGGSVKPEVAGELYAQNDIDGFLVGGASLVPSFVDIINACAK